MGRKKISDELYRFGVSMDKELIEKFDNYLLKRGYYNRSEALRDLVRDSLAKEKIEIKNQVVYGVISFIYNHHKRELEDRISEYQHNNYQSIISTTHIHISHEKCLEVIITKDKANKIKELAESIFALKGVENGKISFLTSV